MCRSIGLSSPMPQHIWTGNEQRGKYRGQFAVSFAQSKF